MVNEIRKFSAPWALYLWVTTIVIGFLVFVLIPYLIINAVCTKTLTDQSKALLFLLGLVPFIFVLALFFAPIKYTVTNSEVIVNRLGPNVAVPIHTIEHISRPHRKQVRFLTTVRLFGVGGFFGGYGLFWNRSLGVFYAYITNLKTLVFIKYDNGRKILLSPDRPQEFLEAVAHAQTRFSTA